MDFSKILVPKVKTKFDFSKITMPTITLPTLPKVKVTGTVGLGTLPTITNTINKLTIQDKSDLNTFWGRINAVSKERLAMPLEEKLKPTPLEIEAKRGLASSFGLGKLQPTTEITEQPMGKIFYTAGRIFGEVAQMMALAPIAGKIATKLSKAIGGLSLLNPALGRFLIIGTSRATTWGIRGMLEETGKEIVDRELSPLKIVGKGLEEMPFGFVSAISEVSTSTVRRIIETSAGFGGYTAFTKILENHKIEKKDIPDILTSIAVGAILAGINAPQKSQQLRAQELENMAIAEGKMKYLVGHPNATEEEANLWGKIYVWGLHIPTTPPAIIQEIKVATSEDVLIKILKDNNLPSLIEIVNQAKNLSPEAIATLHPLTNIKVLLDKIQELGIGIFKTAVPEVKPSEVVKPEIKLTGIKSPIKIYRAETIGERKIAGEVKPALMKGIYFGLDRKTAEHYQELDKLSGRPIPTITENELKVGTKVLNLRTKNGTEIYNKLAEEARKKFPTDYQKYLDELNDIMLKVGYDAFYDRNNDELIIFNPNILTKSMPIKPEPTPEPTPELKPEVKPEKVQYLYHGTNKARAIKIAQSGLMSGKLAGNTQGEDIFFSNTEQYAQSYADRKGGVDAVILRVKKTPDIIVDVKTGSKGDFKTSKSIMPQDIEIKVGNNWISITQYQPFEKMQPSVAQIQRDIVSDNIGDYLFHTTSIDRLTSIAKNGLWSGGLSANIETMMGEEPLGEGVAVFLRKDFQQYKNFKGGDVGLIQDYTPVKPITTFTFQDLGMLWNESISGRTPPDILAKEEAIKNKILGQPVAQIPKELQSDNPNLIGLAVWNGEKLILPSDLQNRINTIKTSLTTEGTGHDLLKEAQLIENGKIKTVYSDMPRISVSLVDGKLQVYVRYDIDNALIDRGRLSEENRFNEIFDAVGALSKIIPKDTILNIPELKYSGTINDFIKPVSQPVAKEPTKITLQRIIPETRGFNEIKDIQLISETPKNFKVWLPIEKKYQLISKSEWQIKPEPTPPITPQVAKVEVPTKRPTLEEVAKQSNVSVENIKSLFYDYQSKIKVAKNHGDLEEANRLQKELDVLLNRKVPTTPEPITITEKPTGVGMGGVNPIEKVVNALKEAKPIRAEQERIYSQERAKRMERAKAVGEKITGEAGFYAELAQLKGEILKVQFESIRSKVTQEDIEALFILVKDSPLLRDWEKVTARYGLAKLFGEFGGNVPTEGELKLLKKVFPTEFIKTVLDAKPLFDKIRNAGYELMNIPRALMASYDFSGALRQGVFLMPSHPKEFTLAFGNMFRYAFSEKNINTLMDTIAKDPDFPLAMEYELALTDINGTLTDREEAYMSSWAEKIPLIGKGVRASDRAYTGFLNYQRFYTWKSILNNFEKAGLNPKDNPKTLKDLTGFINNGTGRGNLPDFLKSAQPLLNGLLFSPRLMAARINLLNPFYYAKLSPPVRKEALKSLLAFIAFGITVLSMAKLAFKKVKIGGDWRSADVGKIKIGNTRIDIWGGFQQYARLVGQLVSGQYVSTTTGVPMTLGEGYKPLTRLDILTRFLEYKEAPIASLITDLLKGQTAIGEPLTWKKEILDRLTPMVFQDFIDLAKDNPDLLPLGIFGIFGVGLQTYDITYTKSEQISVDQLTKQGVPKEEIKRLVIEARITKQIKTQMGFVKSDPDLTDKEKIDKINKLTDLYNTLIKSLGGK
jgi:hypothetical protein